MAKTLDEIDVYYTEIREAKKLIADLQSKKIQIRAEEWHNAEGIADAKKDYVRSMVSDIQKEIDFLEADVEYYYNQVKILTYKLELGDE